MQGVLFPGERLGVRISLVIDKPQGTGKIDCGEDCRISIPSSEDRVRGQEMVFGTTKLLIVGVILIELGGPVVDVYGLLMLTRRTGLTLLVSG